MALLCTSFNGFSTARTFPSSSSNFHAKVIPTKVRCSISLSKEKRSSIKRVMSKCLSDRNSSNIFYHPNCSFPEISPRRETIPLFKVIPNQTQGETSDSSLTKIMKFCDALLRFIKLDVLIVHTAVFTGIMLRTWMENANLVKLPNSILFLRAMMVFVAVVCNCTIINGINQIFDIQIDKINKPHYPLTSGQMSLRTAWMVVTSSVVICITISIILKSGTFLAFVLASTLFGSLYSIPPFSTKRSTIGAPLTCALLWVTITLGLSAASRTILGLPFELSTPIIALTIFASSFLFVCGALKDIEDVEGDEKFNVPTLASIYGSRKVAFFGFGFIVLTYVGAILTALLLPQVFRQNIMITAHVILALIVIFQAWKLEKENYTKEASKSMYQSILKLLAFEFVLFPFM